MATSPRAVFLAGPNGAGKTTSRLDLVPTDRTPSSTQRRHRMIRDEKSFIEAVDGEGDDVERAMQRSVRKALREHKRLGHSVAVWRDGKTVILAPDEIDVPESDEDLEDAANLPAATTNGAGH